MEQKVSKVACVSKNLSILVLLFSLLACSLLKHDQVSNENPATLTPPQSETTSISVYFPKLDTSGLHKSQTQVETSSKNINQTLNKIMAELSRSNDESVYAVFPEKIDLYGAFIDKDMLYLDFSSVIQKAVFPNIQMEQLALEAFLTTIKFNFATVTQVKFLSEHEDTQIIFGHTYAQQPFSLKDM